MVRRKHIEVRFHFLRDYVDNGRLEVNHCPISESRHADILTMGLKKDMFLNLRKKLGIVQLIE
jgi:hypothetical protein